MQDVFKQIFAHKSGIAGYTWEEFEELNRKQFLWLSVNICQSSFLFCFRVSSPRVGLGPEFCRSKRRWNMGIKDGGLIFLTWVFPKIRVPQNGWWKSWKTFLKWMIWGYHHLRKHPPVSFGTPRHCFQLPNNCILTYPPWFNRLPLKILTSFQMDGDGGFKDLLFHPFHQVTISGGFGFVVWVFLITLGLGDPYMLCWFQLMIQFNLRPFFPDGKKHPPTRNPVGNPLTAPEKPT